MYDQCGHGLSEVAPAYQAAKPAAPVKATASLIPRARFEPIRAYGHIPPVEQPDALLALLNCHFEEFLHA